METSSRSLYATVWRLPGGERNYQDTIVAKKFGKFFHHSLGIAVMLKRIMRDNDVKFLRMNLRRASVAVTKVNNFGLSLDSLG
jgi:hypothetical protein